MNDYEISEIALQEIEEIVDYVAATNPDAADRVRDGIFKGCEQLANRPGLGHRRPDLTKLALRFRTVMRRYLIAYRGDAPHIEIVRVFGPGRDVAKLLR
jgi:plasmid stabilization system protein ParE